MLQRVQRLLWFAHEVADSCLSKTVEHVNTVQDQSAILVHQTRQAYIYILVDVGLQLTLPN